MINKFKIGMISKELFIFLVIITLSGCSYITDPKPFGMYRGMKNGAPEGTKTFKMGWKDGCESGMSAYGSLHYKATHNFNYNENQLKNNEYHSAWRIGFRHCRWYTAEWLR